MRQVRQLCMYSNACTQYRSPGSQVQKHFEVVLLFDEPESKHAWYCYGDSGLDVARVLPHHVVVVVSL